MIKLMKSTFYKETETKNALAEFVIKAKTLSMDEECSRFETAFAKKQENKYAVLVSNGSMANLVLIQALLNLGLLKKGDRVGFSSLTWATNVMPLIQLGLIPVPLDLNLETLNVSSEILATQIKNLQALFLTNVLGFADDISAIAKMCEEHKVLFFEDNCEALGSKVQGKLLGNFGLASTFSFFVGHHLSTIEGGMVVTGNKELYHMLLMVRAHGWDRSLPEVFKKELRDKNRISDFYAKYTFYELAYNGRPTEITGFLGNNQIEFLDEMVEKRQKNFFEINEVIMQNEDFYSLNLKHMDKVSNFAFPVVLKTKELWEKYKQKFEEAQVEIRPIIAGDMTKQPFFKKYDSSHASCTNTSLVHEQGFYFPNNPELSLNDLELFKKLLTK